MNMRGMLAGLVGLLFASQAVAQVQLGAGQVYGNSTAARAPAQGTTVTSILDRALGSTRGSVLRRGASGWEIVVPSATAGLPWVSAGTGADPLYQVVGVVGGGTGLNVYAVGDILCATGTTTLSRIADVATGQVLRSGGVGACPAWGTGAALTKTDDTNVTATLGGNPTIALVNSASITLGWTGTLAVARGGSGAGTQQGLQNAAHNCPPTRAGDLIYYNGTNWVCLAGNNSGTRVLQEDGSGVPSWVLPGTGTVTSAVIAAGNGISVSGTCTITTTGTCTVTRTFTNAAVQQTPAPPPNTGSVTAVMSGFGAAGCTLTPVLNGRMDITIQFYGSNNTLGNTGTFDLRYGTGAAPAANVVVTGTQASASLQATYTAANAIVPMTLRAVVTGLSVGTAYWFDLSRLTNANTLAISNATCIGVEF